MKNIPTIRKLLTHKDFSTKIYIYMSYRVYPEGYDSYENNYEDENLNPKTIRAYVSEITSEALVWKRYGLENTGAVEIVTEEKYKEWFEKCSKVTIDGDDYTVFKEGTGRNLIQKRPMKMLRVILRKEV